MLQYLRSVQGDWQSSSWSDLHLCFRRQWFRLKYRQHTVLEWLPMGIPVFRQRMSPGTEGIPARTYTRYKACWHGSWSSRLCSRAVLRLSVQAEVQRRRTRNVSADSCRYRRNSIHHRPGCKPRSYPARSCLFCLWMCRQPTIRSYTKYWWFRQFR